MLTWDGDGDGRVTKSDVIGGYESSLFPAVGITEHELYPTSKCWLEADLHKRSEDRIIADIMAMLRADTGG